MVKSKRGIFIKILKEICEEQGYTIDFFSQNWIIKITKSGITNYIIAYNFGVNKDASSKICADKTATTEILSAHHVANVEHRLFHIHDNYQNDKGNWENMIDFFKNHHNKIVVKPNVGSNGTGVALIDSLYKLECEIYTKMSKKPAVCFSPFEEIVDEYRVVMLEDEPQLIFKKNKPTIRGNGKDTVLVLLDKTFKTDTLSPEILEILRKKNLNLATILEKDAVVELNWKHNLGGGAKPEIVAIEKHNHLVEIAKKAVKALEMKFASVDIIETENDGFKVLEVNSGVMLINFAGANQEGYILAKGIYTRAIKLMMKG